MENWAAFDDEAGWGTYRAALAGLKKQPSWESERISQEDWWDFLETRMSPIRRCQWDCSDKESSAES